MRSRAWHCSSLRGSGGAEGSASLVGILLVLLSGLSYAIYLVTVNNVRRIREMDNLKLTLYVLLSSAGFFLINASFNGGVQAIPSGSALVNLLLLAFLPTLVSNLALVRAIKSIGSTLTSVLGAMEPLTAIVIGVVVFGETISGTMALGILLIIAAVTIIVLSPLLDKNIAERLRRFAQRPIGRRLGRSKGLAPCFISPIIRYSLRRGALLWEGPSSSVWEEGE